MANKCGKVLFPYGEVLFPENFDEVFLIIDPSELIGHKLLEYVPKEGWQKRLLDDIRKCIDLKVPAFRVPCMDPSEEDGKIVFKPGNRPAVGHSPVWWDKTWQNAMPSKNSRSGTDLHRAAFLGMLMKYLVDEANYSVEAAWEAVCNDSRELGHYMDSKDAKDNFEPTGSRQIGRWFDLGNTFKILKKWRGSGFLLAGGHYRCKGKCYPLADMGISDCLIGDCVSGVGLLVLDV